MVSDRCLSNASRPPTEQASHPQGNLEEFQVPIQGHFGTISYTNHNLGWSFRIHVGTIPYTNHNLE